MQQATGPTGNHKRTALAEPQPGPFHIGPATGDVYAAEIDPGLTGEFRVVMVFGELDMLTIAHLERDIYTLTTAGDIDLILDLSQVRLCDAAAMGGLIRAHKHCRALGGSLRLAAPTGIVAKVFQIVAFDKDLPIYRTVDAARAFPANGCPGSIPGFGARHI